MSLGTADGGHYFSYIRESAEDATARLLLSRGGDSDIGADSDRDSDRKDSWPSAQQVERSRRWIEFNDTEVGCVVLCRLICLTLTAVLCCAI